MFEQAILGTIQGLAEWLPVSSEGLLVLAETHLFHTSQDIEAIIRHALLLHLGTFLAALIYFRKDVFHLLRAAGSYRTQPEEIQRLFSFLFLSTIISGSLGFVLVKLLGHLSASVEWTGRFITLLIGCFLLGTAAMELKAKKQGRKTIQDLKITDGILLGVVQGLSALPGLSRSGLTVSTFLLRKFDKTHALRLSFLMSLPIVLAGNIVLNLSVFLSWSPEVAVGILCAFLFGLATIHILLKAAQKVNFGYFILGFGLLMIVSALV